MKPKKIQKKLRLNKKTVSDLNQGAMKGVRGGHTDVIACFDPGGGVVTFSTCATCDGQTCWDTCNNQSICVTSPCAFCFN